MNSGFSKEFEDKVLNYYLDGNNSTSVSEKFKIGKSYIFSLLKRRGIKSRSSRELGVGEELEEKVCSLYLKGLSALKIANIVGIAKSTARDIIMRNDIIMRGCMDNTYKKYSFNEKYFENIDSRDKAYFLGFLMADGCNTGHAMQISLQEEDRYILEKFSEKMKYTGKIYNIIKASEKHKNMCKLQISSKKLSQDLLKFGIVRRKSLITYFPDIAEEFHSHFIRGVFDGDGCVHYPKENCNTSFTIVGALSLISSIHKILVEKCSLSNTKVRKQGNIYILSFTGIPSNKRIANYLYQDCEDLFLTRKREKFDTILKQIDRKPRVINGGYKKRNLQ